MNRAKLVALLLISFIATSSVIYQIRNRKPSQGVVVGSVPEPPVEPPSLPAYSVTGIISGDQGKWAIVDGRLVRPGEQIGTETVKEVKDRVIVLEHDGQTRELPLKKIEDTVA